MNEKAFRSKMFGGFNKSDVLKYLDSFSREYRSEITQLNTEIDRLKEELEATKKENEEKLSVEAMETKRIIVEKYEAKIVDNDTKIQSLECENQSLKDENDKLVEQLDTYRAKFASAEAIEEAARKHAEQIEANEIDELRRIRSEVDTAVSDAKYRFATVKKNADAMRTNVVFEMDKIRDQMRGIGTILEELSVQFDALGDKREDK